jgi:plasmid rolling circle replication initiator protein Rep
MSKIIKKTINGRENKTSTSLDTLEITSDFFLSKSHETLYYSTLRKYSTIQSNLKLIDVAPKVWKDKYWKAYHCKNILLQDGNTLKGSLCRKRWCQNCNRIKTAEMINGYSEPLKELQKEDDLYLITLTSKTVKEKRLRFEIERRNKAFTRIKDSLRKNHNIKLVGCRKLEVTYNHKDDKYHPHFHFIQQGKKEAEMLLKYWYKHNPNASEKAQDIRPINANDYKSLIEVFKYATKEVAKDEINAKALHNIYVAIDGKRVFQTYGKLRKVKEIKEAKEEVNNADFIPSNNEIYEFDISLKDYTNAYGQDLIGTQQIEHDIKQKEYREKTERKNV